MPEKSDRYWCVPCDKWHTFKDFEGSLCKDYIFYEGKNDLIKFGRLFLPKDFVERNKTPQFHHEIGQKLIKSGPGARICNIVPRGFAKSTLCKAALLHRMFFRADRPIEHVPWLCETQKKAIRHIAYIKQHIETNARLKYYFGNRFSTKKWTQDEFITSRGDTFFAVGMDQNLRGGVTGAENIRYTIVVPDDFESEKNTLTEESRQKNKDAIASTILPSLEETSGMEGEVWLNGTIVHFDSFLQSVYDYTREEIKNEEKPTWDLSFYRATHDGRLENTSRPLWEDRFPVEKLRSKKKEFESLGAVHRFPREYMNDARDEASAPVKVSRIRNHYAQLRTQEGQAYLIVGGFDEKGAAYAGDKLAIPVYIYMGVDPAQVVAAHRDYSAIMILAIDGEQRRYTLEIFRERIPGFEISKKMVELAKKYPISRVNIDPTGGSEVIANMYNRLSKEERKSLPGCSRKDVKYPGGIKKSQRNIDALAPVVNNGLLYMRPEHKALLSDEAYELPFPKYDDVLDGWYLANYTARRRFPRSTSFDAKELESGEVAYKSLYPKKKPNWRSKSIWRGTWKTG